MMTLARETVFQDPPLRTSRIVIVGFGSGDRHLIPWDEPGEVWTLNNAHGCDWMRRWDRLFEVHTRTDIALETAEMKRDVNHLGLLQAERTRPIYMTAAHDDIPCAVPYPLAEVQAFFGAHCEKLRAHPYITSTFGLMMALAIVRLAPKMATSMEPPEIQVYGVPLLNDEEYAYQRENASFFAGACIGHGIRLTLSPDSTWLEADGVYGFARAESLELLSRMKAAAIAERDTYAKEMKDLEAEYQQVHRKLNTADGARQYADKMVTRLTLLMRGAKL